MTLLSSDDEAEQWNDDVKHDILTPLDLYTDPEVNIS